MPNFGAPRGHHRDSVVAPMWPRYFHHMFFTDSRTLGYDYDNFDYGKQKRRHPDTYMSMLPFNKKHFLSEATLR